MHNASLAVRRIDVSHQHGRSSVGIRAFGAIRHAVTRVLAGALRSNCPPQSDKFGRPGIRSQIVATRRAFAYMGRPRPQWGQCDDWRNEPQATEPISSPTAYVAP